MLSAPKVSIVLLALNENFLNVEFLNSIFEQSLQEIEIICIEVGINDTLLNSLKEKDIIDSRLTIIKMEQLSHGAAFNLGIEKSRGKYILFLNSDTVLNPNMLDEMFKNGEKNNSDIVISGVKVCSGNSTNNDLNNEFLRRDYLGSKEIVNKSIIPERIFTFTNYYSFNKMYRRDFINTIGLRFQNYNNSEDLYFNICALCFADRISYINSAAVKYYEDRKKIQTNLAKEPCCFIDALTAIKNKLIDAGIFPALKRQFINFSLSVCVKNMNLLLFRDERINLYRSMQQPEFLSLGLTEEDDSFYDNLQNKYHVLGIRNALYQYDSFINNGKKSDLEIVKKSNIEGDILVSVIIPVYNVGEFLCDCINSVIGQSLHEIEIICIDDGSTDKSLEILMQYAFRDNRISVYRQENRGPSTSRNRGLKLANGKYIYFLDSDDYLEINALEIIYKEMEDGNLDIVAFDARAFIDNDFSSFDNRIEFDSNQYIRNTNYEGIYKGTELMVAMDNNKDYYSVVWIQAYKRSFLEDQKILFYDGIIHEDNLFTFSAWIYADRIGYMHHILYNRRYRSNSIMTAKVHFEHSYGYFICYLYMLKETLEIQSNPAFLDHASDLINRMLKNARNIYKQLPMDEQFSYMGLPLYQLCVFDSLVFSYNSLRDSNTILKEKIKRTYAEKSEINAKLQQTYKEKSEINAKLQQAYAEKSEINAKLQQAYAEKSEINAKLQQTYKEKSEINAKLQQTYKEKAERGIEIKRLISLQNDQKKKLSVLEEENSKLKKSSDNRV